MKCDNCGKQLANNAKSMSNHKRWCEGRMEQHRGKGKYGTNLKGSKNHLWAGNNVSYRALHTWVRKWLPCPDRCVDCGVEPPKDVANISQEYRRDLEDWEWLCRRCHMVKDGRMKKLGTYSKKTQLTCDICPAPFVAKGYCMKHYNAHARAN